MVARANLTKSTIALSRIITHFQLNPKIPPEVTFTGRSGKREGGGMREEKRAPLGRYEQKHDAEVARAASMIKGQRGATTTCRKLVASAEVSPKRNFFRDL